MKKLLASIATVATLAFAAPAFAEYQSPLTAVRSGTILLSIDGSPPSAVSFAASGDGLAASRSNGSDPIANGDSVTYTFTIPDSWRNDLTLVIYTPALPGTGTWAVGATYTDNGAGTFSVAGQAIANGNAIRIAPGSFASAGGFLGAGRTLTTLAVTFTYTGGDGPTGLMTIDLISNPEPGTLALFGLGSLALGGFAWRRRKARKAAAASA